MSMEIGTVLIARDLAPGRGAISFVKEMEVGAFID